MKNPPEAPCPKGLILSFTAALLHACTQVSQAGQTEWKLHKSDDGQYPTAVEQQMMWLMNRARANPAAEGLYLANLNEPFTVEARDFYQIDIVRMLAEFALIPPSPPIAFDRRLHEASRQHSQYLIQVDSQNHVGQEQKLAASGYVWADAMMSVFSYCEDGVMAHAALNIDYGGPASEGGMQVGRGHRVAIMSSLPLSRNFSSAGLAMVVESSPWTEVGPYVFSGAYASAKEGSPDAHNRFVVGTVWDDRNGNRVYDPGEGLGGVEVRLDQGEYYAVTGSAGGFAIPVTTPGDYVISYSGGAFPGFHSAPLKVGEVSVPADAEVRSLPLTKVPFASKLEMSAAGGLRLSWSGGKPPYQIQRCDSLGGEWRNHGEPTRENSAQLPMENRSGFFRIRSQ